MMNEDVIFELARKFLDEYVTVYFANEYIRGKWFSIDAHTKVMGIAREGRKYKCYIDIESINAIEVVGDE